MEFYSLAKELLFQQYFFRMVHTIHMLGVPSMLPNLFWWWFTLLARNKALMI